MKDNSINETFNFELSIRKIKDLDMNVSSSLSYDYSYSFDIQKSEYLEERYSKEEIKNRRTHRKKIPNDIR